MRARRDGDRAQLGSDLAELYRFLLEQADQIDAVRVSEDVLCVFNATPLEKYENYRLCQLHGKDTG